ncbi:MAG: GumC family protein [Hyphomicrobiaceae bacterium]
MAAAGPGRQRLESEEADLSLADLVRVIARFWLLIIGSAAVVAALVAQYMVLQDDRYVAYATVQVEQRRKQVVDIEAVLSDISASAATVENEIEVLRSATLARVVIQKLDLRNDPEFAAPPPTLAQRLIAYWTGRALRRGPITAPDPQAPPPDPREVSAIETYIRGVSQDEPSDLFADHVLMGFLEKVNATRIRNSHSIEVAFEAQSAEKAVQILNALVDSYIEIQVRTKSAATAEAQRLLDERITALRARLGESERKLEAFKASNEMFDTDGRLLVDRQLAREMEALVKASADTAAARARFEQARRMMVTGANAEDIADVLQNQTIAKLREELTRTQRRSAELATRYGAQHPAMIASVAEVQKTRAALTEQVNSIIANLRTEKEIAETREAELRANLEVLKQRVAEVRGKTWQADELARETDANRRLYEALLARSKQMTETVGLEFPDARIVQRASLPTAPVGPKRAQAVVLAFVASLLGTFAAAFLYDFNRATIAQLIPARPSKRGNGTQGSTASDDPSLEPAPLYVPHIATLPRVAPETATSPMRMARLVVADPAGAYARAVKALADDLLQSHAAEQGALVVLFASVTQGEGSSTLASNIATALATGGRRTLLIDGDVSGEGLSRMLGVGAEIGLTDVLAARAEPSAALLTDETTGLSMIAARGTLDRHEETDGLISSRRAHDLFAAARTAFDVVIIDAPPVLASGETAWIAVSCDTVVLTVTWQQTSRSLVRAAVERLRSEQAPHIGIALNNVSSPDDVRQPTSDLLTAQAAPFGRRGSRGSQEYRS